MACDVFISYSHHDEEFPNGWVSCLHDRLEAAIRSLAPDIQITICRDALDIRRSENFGDSIKTMLKEARVLLCVMSRSYNNSRYCAEELDYFLRQHRVQNHGLVRVGKNPVDVLLQPEPFQNMLGHDLYEKRTGTELPVLNAQGNPDPRFDLAIAPLAQEIVQLVEASRAPKPCVLVLASPDREDERLRLANDLLRDGVDVVPSENDPLPFARNERRDALSRHSNRVDFAVLLVGVQPSKDIIAAYDAFEQRWPSSPRRCLFGTPLIPPTDAAQTAFLDRINEAGPAFDICDRPDQIFPETRRLLKALNEQVNRTPTLYLSYVKSSRESAAALRQEIRRLSAERRDAADAANGRSCPIRILDPYGDGDSPAMRTQTAAKDKSLRASHGGLVLVEQEGAFVHNALRDFDDAFSGDLRRYVAIDVANDRVNVPQVLARDYAFIQPEDAQRRTSLPPDARTTTLASFLDLICARAGGQ